MSIASLNLSFRLCHSLYSKLILFVVYSLEDLVAHEDIVNILTKLIDSDNLPHLLLYGPPGKDSRGI